VTQQTEQTNQDIDINQVRDYLKGRPDIALTLAVETYNGDAQETEDHIQQLEHELSEARIRAIGATNRHDTLKDKFDEIERKLVTAEEQVLETLDVHQANLHLTNKVNRLEADLGRINHNLSESTREIKRLNALQPDKLTALVKRYKSETATAKKNVETHRKSAVKAAQDMFAMSKENKRCMTLLKDKDLELRKYMASRLYKNGDDHLLIWPAEMNLKENGKQTNPTMLVYIHANLSTSLVVLNKKRDGVDIHPTIKTLVDDDTMDFAFSWLNKIQKQNGVILDEDYNVFEDGELVETIS